KNERRHRQYRHLHRRALLLQSSEQTLRNGKDSRVLQVGDSLLRDELESAAGRFPLDSHQIGAARVSLPEIHLDFSEREAGLESHVGKSGCRGLPNRLIQSPLSLLALGATFGSRLRA